MITPTSVDPYMLRGVTPKVSWMNLQVEMSMGSPVKGGLGGRERIARGDPGGAQRAIDGRGRRHVGDLERAERLEDTPGVEPACITARGDAERERGDRAVPEPVAPGGRRRAEVPVARAQADAV